MEQKCCRVCKQTKPVSEFGRLRDGYAYECKSCKSELDRKYREKNKEKVRESKREHYKLNSQEIRGRSKLWYEENKDAANARQAAYNLKHRERVLEYKRKWRAENKTKILDQAKEYRLANRDAVIASIRDWFAKNPEKRKEYFHARRARLKQAGGRFTTDQINTLREKQRGLCACCGIKLAESGEHIDHIHPIARGGTGDITNIQLLCPSCNMRKKAKHPVDFMQENGFLL